MLRLTPRFGAEKFPSISKTLFPRFAIAEPKESTAEVFPTPPFRLKIPIVLPIILNYQIQFKYLTKHLKNYFATYYNAKKID
jgi:hypothetical protein